jgi:hypothetical protein
LNDLQAKKLIGFVLSIVVLGCLGSAMHYRNVAKVREGTLLSLFEIHQWSGLNETFETPTPDEPIVSRMKTVQEEIKSDDAVVFLSPFDHLMSFYSNPKSYCGHFEFVTNLVTYGNVNDVVSCVRHNPNALLVYDDAMFNKCPVLWHLKFYPNDFRSTINELLTASQGTMDSCEAKNKLYETMQSIMDTLKPELVLVKKVGPLSFYRHVGETTVPSKAISAHGSHK